MELAARMGQEQGKVSDPFQVPDPDRVPSNPTVQ